MRVAPQIFSTTCYFWDTFHWAHCTSFHTSLDRSSTILIFSSDRSALYMSGWHSIYLFTWWNSQKSIFGHNFWLECSTDLNSTFLNCIFNALFRDIPLGHVFSLCPYAHIWPNMGVWPYAKKKHLQSSPPYMGLPPCAIFYNPDNKKYSIAIV